MQACLAHLNWTPVDFWAATPHEVAAAFATEEEASSAGFSKLYDSIPDRRVIGHADR